MSQRRCCRRSTSSRHEQKDNTVSSSERSTQLMVDMLIGICDVEIRRAFPTVERLAVTVDCGCHGSPFAEIPDRFEYPGQPGWRASPVHAHQVDLFPATFSFNLETPDCSFFGSGGAKPSVLVSEAYLPPDPDSSGHGSVTSIYTIFSNICHKLTRKRVKFPTRRTGNGTAGATVARSTPEFLCNRKVIR